uniref:Secreted RxLR effector protein 114 n=1 Tax=Plasmopara viticola TaxID=143451 RepID=RL114_PLAVT|nr:RecName: Full=Secreted RxLR effector protein 114; Flags: Precursor [Plasmopara viticola]
MCGAHFVAIALLVAAGCQTAAEFDQDDIQQTSKDDSMASIDLLQSRNLRESRDSKDDLLSAGDEERTPPFPSGVLKEPKVADSTMAAANVMRTEGEASAIKAASKNLNQLKSNKPQRIAPASRSVAGQVLHSSPDSDKSLVSVENEQLLVLAKRRRTKHPTAMMTNAVRSAEQHDYRLAPTESSTLPAQASDGQLSKQLITQKVLQLDKKKHVDESLWREELMTVDEVLHLLETFDKPAHPTAVNVHEANAIGIATKKLNYLRRNKRKRIAPTSNNVVGQVPHAQPDPDKSPVLVAKDIPSVLAKRLRTDHPTAIMENAARFVTQHNYRLAPTGPSTIIAATPNSQLKYHLPGQKALHLDKNEHAGDLKSLRNEESHTIEHILHLRERNDKSAHTTAENHQSVPEDWNTVSAKGPKLLSKDSINEKVKKVHAAFVEAFNLPFHQYPEETAMMLKLVQRKTKSSPNNGETYDAFMYMAELQQHSSHLRKLLGPDLKMLLGTDKTVLPIKLENLQEAYNVKLVIMYDLFFEFCHDRKDLVEGLPRKPKPNQWILKLST